MLLYAASAEHQPRPWFQGPAGNATQYIRESSFGHTLPGSLVFTISSPRVIVQPRQLQLDIFAAASSEDRALLEREARRLSTPFARRVNERVARGLETTRESAQRRDHSVLLERYGDGMNANMCNAVSKIAANGRAEVEFQFAWSKVVPPAEDLADFLPVQVSKDQCDNLRSAAVELREAPQDPIIIRGNVHGLLVTGDPKQPDSRRSMFLYGTNPVTKRSAQFIVPLETEDYERAVKAQTDWSVVQVTGVPVRAGANWRVADARDFAILS